MAWKRWSWIASRMSGRDHSGKFKRARVALSLVSNKGSPSMGSIFLCRSSCTISSKTVCAVDGKRNNTDISPKYVFQQTIVLFKTKIKDLVIEMIHRRIESLSINLKIQENFISYAPYCNNRSPLITFILIFLIDWNSSLLEKTPDCGVNIRFLAHDHKEVDLPGW